MQRRGQPLLLVSFHVKGYLTDARVKGRAWSCLDLVCPRHLSIQQHMFIATMNHQTVTVTEYPLLVEQVNR